MSRILKYLPAVMIPAALLIGVCLFWEYSFKMLARERCCGEMIEFRDLLLNGRRLDEIRNDAAFREELYSRIWELEPGCCAGFWYWRNTGFDGVREDVESRNLPFLWCRPHGNILWLDGSVNNER